MRLLRLLRPLTRWPCHDAASSEREGALAPGFIDMRKGIDGLAMLVQGVLHQDPFTGHLFVFRGRTRAQHIGTWYGPVMTMAGSPAVRPTALPCKACWLLFGVQFWL
jgi:transposase